MVSTEGVEAGVVAVAGVAPRGVPYVDEPSEAGLRTPPPGVRKR